MEEARIKSWKRGDLGGRISRWYNGANRQAEDMCHLQDLGLRATLEGQPSNFHMEHGLALSRINLCYQNPTVITSAGACYAKNAIPTHYTLCLVSKSSSSTSPLMTVRI